MRMQFLKFVALSLSVILIQPGEIEGKNKKAKLKSTVAIIGEDDYDVDYVKMDLNATNLSTAISGHVITRARVVNAFTDYYFELSDQLIIDSAKVDGQLLPATLIGNYIRKITLPASLPVNSLFTADIYYHGAPTGGTQFFTNGILHQTDPVYGVQVTHTVSAAYHSRDWWPCKQSLTDKIDSADIWITVPNNLQVAGNGLLNVTPVGGGFDRYEWSSRYPVDYYLLSFSVAPYDQYNYYAHFAGGDSMLVQNFIYDDTLVLQQHKAELDTTGLIINHFSELFGKYPFNKEKFGICMTPLGGGMENQTMVSLGSLETTLIAHELSHQWWGDHVTCGTIKDMWLNEGFARYCEVLYAEHFWGQAAAKNYRTSVFNIVMSGAGGTVNVSDTTLESTIYNWRLTYNKGAAVAHMLRFLVNNDNVYFNILKSYQQQFSNSTATNAGLLNIANQLSGQSLDTFFNQWVYKEGYPRYTCQWAQSGSQVVIKLLQSTTKPTSVSLFKLPIDIRLNSAQGDTTIRIYNDASTQYYTFSWSKTMNNMTLDPDNHIVDKVLSITNIPNLTNILSPLFSGIEIFPNPAVTEWKVKNLPINATLSLTDITGKKLWQAVATEDSISIQSAHLPTGSYLLNIKARDQSMSYQLLR
jgi:aminopeptidase N